MPSAILRALAGIGDAVSKVFGYLGDRNRQNNTQPMVNNQMGRDQAKRTDSNVRVISKAIKGDKDAIEELRRRAAHSG